jgi:phosphonate transport system ATP-binding protein
VTAAAEALVRIRALRVVYPSRTFSLEIPALEIRRGERLALLGSSGSGKTTLLRAMKGVVELSSGQVELLLDGQPVQAPRRRARSAALIYQQFNLVGRATVYENILTGCLGRLPLWRVAVGAAPESEREAAVAIACELGLSDCLLSRAGRISGGQAQRVAIARAALQRAPLVLADEPVASLDPATGAHVLEALQSTAARYRQTLVMSLHDPDAARSYADRIVGLRGGRLVFDLPARDVGPAELNAVYG